MKLDMAKADKNYYHSMKVPEEKVFTEFNYLTIVGKGDPNGVEFQEAISSLYPLAYGIKKVYKARDLDFVVGKLEGLWWVEGGQKPLDTPRAEWYWKLLIRMPEFVEQSVVDSIVKLTGANQKNEKIRAVKFEPFFEGHCVQIMHVGPYSQESESLNLLYEYIEDNGFEIKGKHHEIYLSDPRKGNPLKMKTILRYPIQLKD